MKKNGCDYIYISVKEFEAMQKYNEFAHIKISDFDNTKYGVSKKTLSKNILSTKIQVFSSHGVEEAYLVSEELQKFDILCKIIYLYMPEKCD